MTTKVNSSVASFASTNARILSDLAKRLNLRWTVPCQRELVIATGGTYFYDALKRSYKRLLCPNP